MNSVLAGKPSDWCDRLDRHCQSLSDQWVAIRRHLHQYPELSEAEYETTEYLLAAYATLELPTHVPGEGRGLTVDFVSSPKLADADRIAIRGDIDALPIQDNKSVAYRSTCDGVMHACGHDVHASIIYGTMQLLTTMHHHGDLPWPIAVRAIMQPAEEVATGAQQMIHHHALRGIDSILGLHVDPTRRVGCIGLRPGLLTAACDQIIVTFDGKGGHGARPHLTIDPIDASTHWVQTAFRRIARTADPHETVVFSVGQIESGQSPNVIPDHAFLSGTLRSLDRKSRSVALETLEDVCESIQRESGCQVAMRLGASAPAVDNDREIIELIKQTVTMTLSAGAIEWIDQPSMGSEDFSYYLEQVPGAMFRLGVAGDQVGSAPLHTSNFDIDERAIPIGCQLMAATVINHFRPD